MRCRISMAVPTIVLAVGLMASPIRAQTTINPDISAIGDIRLFTHNDETRPDESEELNYSDPSLELGINAYLNPFARADLFLAWHESHSAEIEELYATFLRGLPLDAQIKAGRYRAGFGALNATHPHAYSFINTPLSHQEFLGEEGLIDMGVQASVLVPTGNVYSTLAVDVLKGDFVAGHQHHDDGEVDDHAEETEFAAQGDESEADTGHQPPAFLGRWSSFVALTDLASLQIGISGMTTRDGEDRRFYLGGADAKYKWRPNRYRSLTIHGEVALSHRTFDAHDLEGEEVEVFVTTAHQDDDVMTFDVTSLGGFAYWDYQFRQRYNVGGIVDFTQEAADNDIHRWRTGVFAGFAPVEETSLIRLLVDYNDSNEEELEAFWTATLQLVFSMGPHKPHSY